MSQGDEFTWTDPLDDGITAFVRRHFLALIATLLAASAALLFFFLRQPTSASIKASRGKKSSTSTTDSKSSRPSSGKQSGKKQTIARSKSSSQASRGTADFAHPWLTAVLKGHAGRVLDLAFSDNDTNLITCDDERKIFLWNAKDFGDKIHKFSRVNVDFDHAVRVKWLPDAKGFLAFGALARRVTHYKTTKRNDGSVLAVLPPALEFPPLISADVDDDIVGLGVATVGGYVMTCTGRGSTLTIWNLKGHVLASVNTLQVECHCAQVSPCARFVGAAGFTAVVAVWSVVMQKSGEFKSMDKAFQLKGHSAAVVAFAFNGDSSRMASVSKDNTWMLWCTEVRIESGLVEPYMLVSGESAQLPDPRDVHLAMSPDGRVVAIAAGSLLRIVSASIRSNVDIDCQDEISQVAFESSGKRMAVAVGRHIRLFHNVVGLKALIDDLQKTQKTPQAKSQSQSTKERISKQIDDARASLDALGVR